VLTPAGDAAIPYPSQTALLADCAYWLFACVLETDRAGRRYSTVAYANAIRPREGINICYMGNPGEERHGTGSNIAFADGHVRFLAADRFLKRKEVRDGTGVVVEYPIVNPSAVLPQ
jgi:prepilin-type processing-associated H-X9-DG protein